MSLQTRLPDTSPDDPTFHFIHRPELGVLGILDTSKEPHVFAGFNPASFTANEVVDHYLALKAGAMDAEQFDWEIADDDLHQPMTDAEVDARGKASTKTNAERIIDLQRFDNPKRQSSGTCTACEARPNVKALPPTLAQEREAANADNERGDINASEMTTYHSAIDGAGIIELMLPWNPGQVRIFMNEALLYAGDPEDPSDNLHPAKPLFEAFDTGDTASAKRYGIRDTDSGMVTSFVSEASRDFALKILLSNDEAFCNSLNWWHEEERAS